MIITKGKGVQSINDKLYPISTGDVFIISGKTIHYFTDYRDLGILNIMFDQSIFESRKDFLRKIPGYNLVFRIEPSLRADKSFSNLLHLNRRQIAQAMEIIEDMENELNTKQSGYEAETAAQFVRLVVFLSRSVKHTEQDKQAFLRLSILLSNLEENYAAPWNLEKMANAVNMSKNNFLRVFKAAEGCSPIRYLNRLRLDAAARLLREKRKRSRRSLTAAVFRIPTISPKNSPQTSMSAPKNTAADIERRYGSGNQITCRCNMPQMTAGSNVTVLTFFVLTLPLPAIAIPARHDIVKHRQERKFNERPAGKSQDKFHADCQRTRHQRNDRLPRGQQRSARQSRHPAARDRRSQPLRIFHPSQAARQPCIV